MQQIYAFLIASLILCGPVVGQDPFDDSSIFVFVPTSCDMGVFDPNNPLGCLGVRDPCPDDGSCMKLEADELIRKLKTVLKEIDFHYPKMVGVLKGNN